MNKVLMVVGSGEFQLPAVIKAKEMGLKVIATDINPNAAGFKYADSYEIIDIKDKEKNLAVAKKFDIDGIIGIVSEFSVRTVSYIAEQLNLPGLNYNAAVAVTDKAIMREKFAEAGLPSPKFFKIEDKNEALNAVSELGLPVVMKPTDNSGSRGVTKIERLQDLDASFKLAKENSNSGNIIVEEFIEGSEMTIEGLSYKGEHQILAMSSKKRIPFPHCVSIDLTYPPAFSDDIINKIKDLMISAYDSLGIDMGATHSEVLITEKGPFLVEVAARGGGFGIFPDIITAVSGVDVVKECINMAMGYEVDVSPKFSRAAVLRFFNLPLGKLLKVTGLEEAKKAEGVHFIKLDVKPGDVISPITRDGNRHGRIIAFGETREMAVARADQAENAIKFDIH